MDWHVEIPACFGKSKTVFESDVAAQAAAPKFFSHMRELGISWNEAISAIAQYLLGQECSVQQIDEQITLIERKFRPWLE